MFYGRERLTAELAVKVATRAARGGIVIVVRHRERVSPRCFAGLLPKLSQGRQVAGSDCWPRVVITPTRSPLTELATRLAALGGSDAHMVREELVRRPAQAHLAVWTAVLADASRYRRGHRGEGDAAPRLVLIVDQFEQVFTLNQGPESGAERQAFITALCTAATLPIGPRQAPPAVVVIAVRGDFWDRCAGYPELAAAQQEGQFLVGPMTESDLRLAIPVRRIGPPSHRSRPN